MTIMDVFHQDPFRTIELTTAVEKVPYIPDGLGVMGVFEDKPIRTEALMVESRQGVLTLVPFTDRGAPGTQRTTERRDARFFSVGRLKVEDTIYASEIAGIREFGQESVMMQIQAEVARRLVGPTGLRSLLEYTREFHRLAAVQGLLLDADGSTRYNWFTEFGITPNPTVAFNLAAKVNGSLRPLCNELTRTMKRKAQGAFTPRTRIKALCGDAFWDNFITHPDVEKTYLNWREASDLRKGTAFETYSFSEIDWTNYRGSDNVVGLQGGLTSGSGVITLPATVGLTVGMPVSGPGIPAGAAVGSISAGVSVTLASGVTAAWTGAGVVNFGGTIEVPSNKAIFFPAGAPSIFQQALAPAATMEWVNTLGKREYVQMIFDRDRQEWVKPEMSTYPLHICTRPEVLFTGTMDSAAD